MKTSSSPYSENQQPWEETLNLVTHLFPGSKDNWLPFIGTFFYLKKKGMQLVDQATGATFIDRPSELDQLLAGDPLRDVIFDNVRKAKDAGKYPRMRSLLAPYDTERFRGIDLLSWYDGIIKSVYLRWYSYRRPMIPWELVALAQAFVGDDAKKTLVPFGGIMNFATGLHAFDSIEAFETDKHKWQVGMLRAALAGVASKLHFHDQGINGWTTNTYDTIISMPPHGVRVNMEVPSPFSDSHSVESADMVAPARFLESTRENGVCVAYAPLSLLAAEGPQRRFRQWALDQGIIDTIIQLPDDTLFDTSIALACIVLRKRQRHTGVVRMVDASRFFTGLPKRKVLELDRIREAYHTDMEMVSRTVSYQEIREHDCSWYVKAYFQEATACPEGFSLSPLADLVSLPQLQRSYGGDKGLLVKLADLSKDWTHPDIRLEALEEDDTKSGYQRLDRQAVLVSTLRTLNPSIIEASKERPVWVTPNILVMVPNDNIDARYLCKKLAELKNLTMGSSVPRIPRGYLLSTEIAYPELAMQKTLYEDSVRTQALSKAKELGLQDIIDQMKAEYINEVRIRKHDMKTPMTQLRNTLTLIRYLAKNLPEENQEQLDKYVAKQEIALGILSDIVEHIADENAFGIPEVFNIEDALKELKDKTNKYTDKCKAKYQRDESSLEEAEIDTPYLKMAKTDFDCLARNIISNAIEKGFVRNDVAYELVITLSVDDDFFVIDFTNNGDPLPEGMTKERYGIKGVKGVNSKGSGIGGYRVRTITQHYGGDFDLFSTGSDNINTTTIRVKLPIYRKE